MNRIHAAVLFLTAFSLMPPVLAMPPGPGVTFTRKEMDERLQLGIDVSKRPVRNPGTRGIVNGPGHVIPLVVGTKQFPVVAIKFPDLANTNAVAQFDSMLFGTWTSGSAHDYYEEVSYGQFNMTGVVAGWYTSDSIKASYGYARGYARAAALVKEAAQKADATLNYALYDNDDDGYVDAFTCVHAGMGHEETGSGTDIHSHSWDFNSAGVGEYTTNDPWPGHSGQYIKVNDYTTDPERSNYSNHSNMVSIGVFCHEWGHALGLPDLYDTDGGGQGLGNWSIMATGSWGGNGSSPYYPVHMDPWSKMELGWLNPTAVRLRDLYSLPQVETNAKAYWLIGRNRMFKEYFLVENRRKTRFDTLMYNSGLLVYHIDDSVILRRWSGNLVNGGGAGWLYGVALEQADGSDHLYAGSNRGDANDPWPGGLGRTTYDSTSTTPNSRTNYPTAGTLVTGCLAKNIPASASVVACTLASGVVGQFTGGPDAFGYSWKDSDTTGGPGFYWNDISTSGTLLGYGDDARFSFALPYSFSFYGTSYNTVWVCTNGWLSFGADPGTSEPNNTSIPNAGAPNRAVFAFWDDLNVVQSDSGGIFYRNYGTSPNCSTVVMWEHARFKSAADPVLNQATFEVVLYENGGIVVRSRDVFITDTLRKWGRAASVGIENAAGTVGLQYLGNGAPAGNLLSNERAIGFAPSGVTIHDVGATVVLAPAGTIDSGIAVAPACSVANYGNTTESYNVRCKIGTFYNQTASVTGHAPGTTIYVTFPAYSAWPRGTHAVSCSTELSTDATPANDKATGSVTVRVLDAEAVAILAPTGTVDSGAVVAPQANVRNNGTTSATFNVRFDIQGGYSNTQTVTNLASGATTTVTFTNWTANQRGALATRCTTMLAGDLVPANNLAAGSVTVRVRDVGATRVLAPTGTVDSGTVVTPACSVANYGTTTETYSVRCKIGSFYNQTASVTSHVPGTRAYVTFASWTANQRGTHSVSCSTELAGDAVEPNNKATATVGVGVADVGCRALLAPAGTVDSGTSVAPACTVYNYGSSAANYTVRMKVGAGYNQTASVTSHAPGTARYVAFPNWTANLPRGSYAVSCSTQLTGDNNNSNDRQTGPVTIGVVDAAAVVLLAPSGMVDSGAVVAPACTVANYGTAAASFNVRMKVGAGYNETASVSGLAPGAKQLVTFASWTALTRGLNAVSCSTELAGDLVQANNRLTGSVTVRVSDVGCAALLAPAGNIDSGTVVTPACTVANYGSTAESYTVRMKIGAGYDQTASVTSQPAGARLRVTFPAWTALQRGTSAVSCSTELTGDINNPNDKRTGSVLVRIRDVGCRVLLAPSGAVDSGTVVTPACTVANYGSVAASYNVRMRIGSLYNNAATVLNQAPNTALYVTFPAWTALQRGTNAVSCSTAYTGDQFEANNRQTDSVSVRVRDVGCAVLVAPAGTVDSGTFVTPACTVANHGTTTETYAVRMRIGTSYDQTATVTAHAAGARLDVTFPAWTAVVRGSHAVRCSTELSGDLVPANDRRTGSVDVRVPDVGCVTILAPSGTIDSGTVVTPACTVANYGSTAETYTVRMRIGAGYDTTVLVSNHPAGTRLRVTFPAWTALLRGTCAVSCSTELAADVNPANDRVTGEVAVRVRDAGCATILAPAGTIDSGMSVAPACTVVNYGTDAESYDVRCRVGSFYNQTASVTGHVPGTRLYVTFPAWTAWPRGSHAVSCSTELASDVRPGNDASTGAVDVRVIDVGCARITAPAGIVDTGDVVTPSCTVANYGTTTESYNVRMRIGTTYNQTAAVTGHAAGTRLEVTFPAWVAGPRGPVTLRCSTELGTDMARANDKDTGSVGVSIIDVAAVAILAPAGTVPLGSVVTPRARVRNLGSAPATFGVRFSITPGYVSTRTVTGLARGDSATVVFDDWPASMPGSFATACSTELAGDDDPGNNRITGSARVEYPWPSGWRAMSPMPTTPSGKAVKDGGWVTYDAGTGLVYAAKGNKTTDFYCYNPRTDSWRQLAPVPMGTEAKAPSKGAVGCADGAGVVYATKGNNTFGFYKYVAAGDSWYALAGVPPGVSGKKVKGGTDLAFVAGGPDYVYCLKGYNNEFYRYRPDGDSWTSLPAAPAAKYDKGSWLAYVPGAEFKGQGSNGKGQDGGPGFGLRTAGFKLPATDAGGVIYCHQAKYHGFSAYDLTTQSWTTGLAGMPLISRSGRSKKSKDGGSAALLGSAVYAFKGGNTQEFWQFLPGSGAWAELETMPQLAPGGLRKSKIKAGADLTACLLDQTLLGLKGNKTLDLWRYVPAGAPEPAQAQTRAGAQGALLGMGSSPPVILPNPLRPGLATVSLPSAFDVPKTGTPDRVHFTILDAAGRSVREWTLARHQNSLTVDLRTLPDGIYMAVFRSRDRTAARKLVVQR